MKKLKSLALLATISFAALAPSYSAYASITPRSLATDSRIKVVNFQEDNVVPIKANTFTVTQIKFGKHEQIMDIQSGDLGVWTATVDKNLPNMLFVKPTIEKSNTNMTVITNKHTYYFHLNSNPPEKSTQATYAVHFRYPLDIQAQLKKQLNRKKQQHRAILNASRNPKAYNWRYTFNGDKRLIPSHVFDDGRFTYLSMRDHQPLPAVFAVDDKSGKESVVNYRIEGHYLVIQRIAPQFTLRNGRDEVASIFNTRFIQHLKRGEL